MLAIAIAGHKGGTGKTTSARYDLRGEEANRQRLSASDIGRGIITAHGGRNGIALGYYT